ncbi:hypothetical protein Tco_0735872 [Tanacetum coccineum]
MWRVHTTVSNVHNYGCDIDEANLRILRGISMVYHCTQPSEEIDKIIQRTQERGIEICRQNEELNRVHEETMQILRKLIKVQDEKRIAKEKEAAELEAKRKSQECLNIEEKSIPQASIRSRKSRIDPTLRNFTYFTKGTEDNSRSLLQDGRDKSVFIKGFINLLSRRATSTMKEAQINVGFCTKILTKEAQTSHQWNDTLAILRCPLLDQTVTNEAQMIEEMNGRD